MYQDENSAIGRWTIEEHQTFVLGFQLYGKNWKKIEQMISTRNCAQIRSHAQKHFLKEKKQKNPNPKHSYSKLKASKLQVNTQNFTLSAKQEQNYSYFMSKIVQFARFHQRLDIWEALIDDGTSKQTVTYCSSEQILNQINDKDITKIIKENKLQSQIVKDNFLVKKLNLY